MPPMLPSSSVKYAWAKGRAWNDIFGDRRKSISFGIREPNLNQLQSRRVCLRVFIIFVDFLDLLFEFADGAEETSSQDENAAVF